MTEYKVVNLSDYADIETCLNDNSALGYQFVSIENSLREIQVIFQKMAQSDTELFSFSKIISPAEIKHGNSSPIKVLASPGEGYFTDIISLSGFLDWGSVQYDVGSDLMIVPEGLTFGQIYLQFILTQTADSFNKGNQVVPGFGNINNILEDKGMYIQADADSSVGDSPVTIYGLYRIQKILV